MKKAINQKVLFNLDSTQNFSVVLTKGVKTYQFNFVFLPMAKECFMNFISEEANFCQLMGTKTTVGLYRVTKNSDAECLTQLQLTGLKK